MVRYRPFSFLPHCFGSWASTSQATNAQDFSFCITLEETYQATSVVSIDEGTEVTSAEEAAIGVDADAATRDLQCQLADSIFQIPNPKP